MESDKKYIEFSSSLSFFEFTQEEFYPAEFQVEEYQQEIAFLSEINSFTFESLVDALKKYPKIIDIFEQIFTLFSFTNTQVVHFFFDISLLNNGNKSDIEMYMKYILEIDKNFKNIYDTLYAEEPETEIKNHNIYLFKKTIEIYKKRLRQKKYKEWAYVRLTNDKSSRERIAKYLIDNQQVNKTLESIIIKNFLLNKRINKDTKNIHGNYGHMRIEKILQNLEIVNIDTLLKENNIKEIDTNIDGYNFLPNESIVFCTEKYVKDIYIPKKNKLKKFDFLIYKNMQLEYLIETNFYSTIGTKIGINEQEYIDLNDEINAKLPNSNFIWVSDGNYWLTSQGKEMYIRGYQNYFAENLMNYSQLEKYLSQII